MMEPCFGVNIPPDSLRTDAGSTSQIALLLMDPLVNPETTTIDSHLRFPVDLLPQRLSDRTCPPARALLRGAATL